MAGLALASPALPAAEPPWQTLAVAAPAAPGAAPPSIRYRVIRPGPMATPPPAGPASAEAWLRFTARRLNGDLVMQAPQAGDASPQPFAWAALAPGLRAAVALMPVGARWEVEVPYALGPLRHNPRFLRGNTLLYDVERSPAPGP